jgi:signal recognition particle receptor subunit beta
MASINFATREINCKIVYYGPGLSGKTTNLQVIHQKLPKDKRSDMVSLATEQDRTLFFDFLPLDLGAIKGFRTKFQLYTVPGQVYYNSTRKLVLRGVDGVVFVADSQRTRMAENIESLLNLQQNLKEYNIDLAEMPFILQYNKRDMPEVFTIEELNAELNSMNVDVFEAMAHIGTGVVGTLKAVAKKVIDKFNSRQAQLGNTAPKSAAPAPAQAPTQATAPIAPSFIEKTHQIQSEVAQTRVEPAAEMLPPKEMTFSAPPASFDFSAPLPPISFDAPVAPSVPVAPTPSAPVTPAPSQAPATPIAPVSQPSFFSQPDTPKSTTASSFIPNIPKPEVTFSSNADDDEEFELRPYIPKAKPEQS